MIEQSTKKESKEMGNDIDITVAGRIKALNAGERRYWFNEIEYKRGKSWEHCHKAFSDRAGKSNNEIVCDYLALQLAFYLASWGMYRGSSFLLDMDYKIHIPAVEMMMEDRYKALFTIGNPFADQNTKNDYKYLMFGKDGIYNKLENHYLEAHKKLKGKDDIPQESDTLLTKILLGVYGCIPAYDRYVRKGLSLFDRQQMLNDGRALLGGKRSLDLLLEKGELKEQLEAYCRENEDYTFMKVVDMYFFSLGACFEEEYDKLPSDEKNAKTEELKEKIKEKYLQQ